MSSPEPSKTLPAADAFLTLIDGRIAALQHLRASYLAARAAGAIGGSGDPIAAAAAAVDGPLPLASEPAPVRQPLPAPAAPATREETPVTRVPIRRRRRQGVALAVREFLPTSPGPQRASDIARALRERGLDAPNLAGTVTSVLHRLRQRGEVERVPDGWVRVTPGMYTASRLEPMPRRKAAGAAPTPDRAEGGLAWKIESLLRSHGQPVAARYVADATGEPVNVVGLTLGRMVRQQRVEQQSDGRFTVVASMAEPAPEAIADSGNGHAGPPDSN